MKIKSFDSVDYPMDKLERIIVFLLRCIPFPLCEYEGQVQFQAQIGKILSILILGPI